MKTLAVISALAGWVAGQSALASDIVTFRAEHSAGPKEVSRQLAHQDLEGLNIAPMGEGYVLSYSGLGAPDFLADFLAANFAAISADSFGAQAPIALSLAIQPAEKGTSLHLMVLGGLDAAEAHDLPEGAEVLLDDGWSADCSGQLVVSSRLSQDATVSTWSDWLGASRFELVADHDETGSFFTGTRPGCAVFMNIEPDPEVPGTSLVVVRFLEE